MAPRVILVGPMGSGKSTVGAILATLLNTELRDTDSLIEEAAGKSVSEIFIEDGEDEFRILEKSILRQELLSDDTVLALGGGACISPDAQSAIKASGAFTVFLDISLAEVAPRIGFNRDRPLLLDNPRGKWLSIMETRRPIYESIAKAIIDTNGKSASDVASEIMENLR